jgi:hypothetical protein
MIMKGFAPENGAKPFAIMKTQGPGGRQPARSWHRTGTVGRGEPGPPRQHQAAGTGHRQRLLLLPQIQPRHRVLTRHQRP